MRILALMVTAFLLTPVHTTVEDVAMIAVEGEGAKYWPRWRGPSGQGLAMGTGYVDKWSDTENVKWNGALLHDVPLTTFCLGSVYFFLRGRENDRFYYPSSLCFVLAVFSKGPVALAVPLGIVLWLIGRREASPLRSRHFWLALLQIVLS